MPTPESDGERIGAQDWAAWYGPRDHTPDLLAVLRTQVEIPNDRLGIAGHRFPRDRASRHIKFAAILLEVYREFVPNLRAGESDLHSVAICHYLAGFSSSDSAVACSVSAEQDSATAGSGALQTQLARRHDERRQGYQPQQDV
ncbi:hypothetical protein [Mycobacterium sp.]|jgi:hypothetical protein|uniref:hypothetical protein n=1 Tax=Mycobacterium sp. TaxID=1785 RepID=UPI003F985D42